jgi:hypothetical protein
MRIGLLLLSTISVLAPVMAAAATLPARQPGLWQSTTSVTDAQGNPLPNAQNLVTVSCVDPATDFKFLTSGASQCKKLAISGQGSDYAINGVCTTPGKVVTIHVKLSYASAQSLSLSAVVESANGPLTVTSQLQYQGDCLPGMKPGDEGSIMNGQFSRADNVLEYQ